MAATTPSGKPFSISIMILASMCSGDDDYRQRREARELLRDAAEKQSRDLSDAAPADDDRVDALLSADVDDRRRGIAGARFEFDNASAGAEGTVSRLRQRLGRKGSEQFVDPGMLRVCEAPQ